MKKTLLLLSLSLSLMALPAQAQPAPCNEPMTAALAGTGSSASGTYNQVFDVDVAGSDPDLVGFVSTVTWSGINATGVELRLGEPGETGGQLIIDFNGQTTSPAVYQWTNQDFVDIGPNPFYVVVTSAAFPNGEIRFDSDVCYGSMTMEGEGEAGNIELPEGEENYECSFDLNGGSVVPPNGTPSTGNAVIEFRRPGVARMLILHDLEGEALEGFLYQGSPGEVGVQVLNLGNAFPGLVTEWNREQLERYTKDADHYVEIVGVGGAVIRGDIPLSCEFDDGVPEGEGEATRLDGEPEAEGECNPLFPEGEPEDLICDLEMTADQVVPPTTSTSQATFRLIDGSTENVDQFFIIVRHDIEDPDEITIYSGDPGTNGTPLRTYSSADANLTCQFAAIETPEFVKIITDTPHYVEITSISDTNATLRADISCVLETGDGEAGPPGGEASPGGEATPEGIDGEAGPVAEECDRLRTVADGLLFIFPFNVGPDRTLSLSEAVAGFPSLNEDDFNLFDDDSSGTLTTGELHRYAGPVQLHDMDLNGDRQFTLDELLRVIQLYNAGFGYRCADPASGTEDGYEPIVEAVKGDADGEGLGEFSCPCLGHASDYEGDEPDFEISLTELLRAIQLFNFGTVDYGYSAANCGGITTEDEFCPGVV